MLKEEILTINIGECSNFVNSHLFNLFKQNGQLNSPFFRNQSVVDGSPSPRNIVIDYKDNIRKPITLQKETKPEDILSWSSKIDVHETCLEYNEDSFDQRWIEYLELQHHEKSFCGLPNWTTESNFDTFIAGLNSDIVPASFFEEVIEKCRFFMEESDVVSSIIITADVYNGYGGVLSRLLEEIRYDMPHTPIPIFALTSPPVQSKHSTFSTKNHTLRQLSLPLSYAKMYEHATMIVPIYLPYVYDFVSFPENNRSALYNSSAVIASALYSLYSPITMGCKSDYAMELDISNIPSQNSNIEKDNDGNETLFDQFVKISSAEWLDVVTCMGKYPFSRIEASIPSPLTNLNISYENTSDKQIEPKRWPNDPFSHYFDNWDPTSSNLNPFTHTLSTVDYMSSIRKYNQKSRAYSNFLVFRGDSFIPGISNTLFGHCVGSQYLLSSCNQCPSSVYCPNRFPLMNPSSSSQIQRNFIQDRISIAAALGSDKMIGSHLYAISSILSSIGRNGYSKSGGVHVFDEDDPIDDDDDDDDSDDRGRNMKESSNLHTNRGGLTVKTQLEGSGLEREECDIMCETLIDCAARYK